MIPAGYSLNRTDLPAFETFRGEERGDGRGRQGEGNDVTPRLRRLTADFEAILKAFGGHPYVLVTPTSPPPPERYRVIYNVPGLLVDHNNQLQSISQHIIDIQLPA